MATPITWRTVEAPDYRSAMDGFDRFGNMLDKSLNGLKQGVQKYDDTISEQVNNQLAMRLAQEQDAKGMRDKLAAGTFWDDTVDAKAMRRISQASIKAAADRPGQILQQDLGELNVAGAKLDNIAKQDNITWNGKERGRQEQTWTSQDALANAQVRLDAALLKGDQAGAALIRQEMSGIQNLRFADVAASQEAGRKSEMFPVDKSGKILDNQFTGERIKSEGVNRTIALNRDSREGEEHKLKMDSAMDEKLAGNMLAGALQSGFTDPADVENFVTNNPSFKQMSGKSQAALLYTIRGSNGGPGAVADDPEGGGFGSSSPGKAGGILNSPVPGSRVTSGYGNRKAFKTNNGQMSSSEHMSVDLSGKIGTPVLAVMDGEVVSVTPNAGGYGKQVKVRYADGTIHQLSHLNGYSVKKGDRVSSGQKIAEIGATGNVTGPHLDWKVYGKDGKTTMNPAEWQANVGNMARNKVNIALNRATNGDQAAAAEFDTTMGGGHTPNQGGGGKGKGSDDGEGGGRNEGSTDPVLAITGKGGYLEGMPWGVTQTFIKRANARGLYDRRLIAQAMRDSTEQAGYGIPGLAWLRSQDGKGNRIDSGDFDGNVDKYLSPAGRRSLTEGAARNAQQAVTDAQVVSAKAQKDAADRQLAIAMGRNPNAPAIGVLRNRAAAADAVYQAAVRDNLTPEDDPVAQRNSAGATSMRNPFAPDDTPAPIRVGNRDPRSNPGWKL